MLSEHGCAIAPSTYYDNLNRQPSKRKLRDAELIELIEDNFVLVVDEEDLERPAAADQAGEPGHGTAPGEPTHADLELP